MRSVGVNPKYSGEQHLLLANIVLQPEDGGQPIRYPGMTMFRIIKVSPEQKWARIQDASFADKNDKEAADFPHALAPSVHAGKTFLIQGPDFDKLIAPRMPAGGMGGMGGGMGGI